MEKLKTTEKKIFEECKNTREFEEELLVLRLDEN